MVKNATIYRFKYYRLMSPKTNKKTKTTVHIGADHRGYTLKYHIKKFLIKKGYEVVDHGNHTYQVRDDYPDYAYAVSDAVKKNTKSNTGILICGSGIGMCVAANKNKCIRAALCWNSKVSEASRYDDDANILVLPADFISKSESLKSVIKFLETKFSGKTKHARRIKKILKKEKCPKDN